MPLNLGRPRPGFVFLGALVLGLLGLLNLNAAAFHWWVSWGPPTPDPQAHARAAIRFLIYGLLLMASIPAVLWYHGRGKVPRPKSSDAHPLELELTRKLLHDLHLSVPERALLPAGRARFSVMVDVARESLQQNGWFPRKADPKFPFSGTVIEARGAEFILHSQGEVGVGRFSDVRTKAVRSLAFAVRRHLESALDIDGVPIDYDA